jgi:glycosyltransferase involved in cell wall biosynthesis
MSEVLEREGIRPVRVSGLGRAIRPIDSMALWNLIRELRQFRPHIVHTHTAKAGALGRMAARVLGVPIVVHTFHGHVFDGYFDPFVTGVFLSIERALAGLTDAIITLSPLQQRDLISRYRIASAPKVHIVPLGFDFSGFNDLAAVRGELHRELSLESGVPLVASIGRLTAIKDHRLLLESFRFVRPNAHLVIVGGGEEEATLRRLARQLDLEARVHFLGFRSDLHRIFADAPVVALTSRNEGTPVALIEAMAAGSTPVSTAVGGVEDVLEGGKWGRLVRSRDPREFGLAIDAALSEAPLLTENEMAARRAYARDRFGVFRLIAEHVALYRDLLEKKRIS